MLGRLLGQELGEDIGGHIAEDRHLEADAGETGGEELSGAGVVPLGERAPRLLLGGAKQLEVEAQVVGDRKRRPGIEIGDEVGRHRRLPRVRAQGVPDRGRLLIDPGRGGHRDEGDRRLLARPGLHREDMGEVDQGQGASGLADRLVTEAGGTRNLEPEPGPLSPLEGGTSTLQIGDKGAGGGARAGKGQEGRSIDALLGGSPELPQRIRQNSGEKLDTEGPALLPLPFRLALDPDRLSVHQTSARARLSSKVPAAAPLVRCPANRNDRSFLKRSPFCRGGLDSLLTGRRDPRGSKARPSRPRAARPQGLPCGRDAPRVGPRLAGAEPDLRREKELRATRSAEGVPVEIGYCVNREKGSQAKARMARAQRYRVNPSSGEELLRP